MLNGRGGENEASKSNRRPHSQQGDAFGSTIARLLLSFGGQDGEGVG